MLFIETPLVDHAAPEIERLFLTRFTQTTVKTYLHLLDEIGMLWSLLSLHILQILLQLSRIMIGLLESFQVIDAGYLGRRFLFHSEKKLLCVRAYLCPVSGLEIILDFLPILAIELKP